MKKRIIIIFVILAIAFVYAYTKMTKIHSFTTQECFKCHNDPNNTPSELRATTVTELCRPCHKRVVMTSTHPVEIVPRTVTIPPGFPLRNGKVTCSTCHDIHKGKESLFGQRTYQLRWFTSDVKFFCVFCHEENFLDPKHATTTNIAHVGDYYRANDDDSMKVDSLSVQCISCHDNNLAIDAGYSLGEGDWNHTSGSHPIGIDYREAAQRNRKLAPLKKVDGRIRLFNGKIGCGTCHDIFSEQSEKLVMSNRGSALCNACHYLY